MLTGCPYESKVPVDSPSVKINTALLGKWEPKSSSSHDTYTVSKKDEFTYIIEKKPENSEPTFYDAHLSNVDDDVFLNVKSSSNTYFLYKLVLNKSGNKVTLFSVTENIDETFTTSEELKVFIKKHKALSFFYAKEEEVFIKAD